MLKLPFKVLLGALFGVGLALAPTFSQALPPLCDNVCSCSGSCNWRCSATDGGYSVTTCGAWGICKGFCRASEPKSAFEQAVLAAEAEPVAAATGCAEQQSQLEQREDATPFRLLE